MNYTREPIIESIITPKEGCKLVVRNSKGNNSEEYFVESVEIVSFSHAIFFRSTERPKSFLVPVTDFEVIELKETKMVLKSTSIEKSIKIGGGKTEEKSYKRKRRQKPTGSPPPQLEKPSQAPLEKGGEKDDGTQVSSSILRKLFPPPPNLIKEKLNHIKSPEKTDESISKEIVKEKPLENTENSTLELKEAPKEIKLVDEIKKEPKEEIQAQEVNKETIVIEETSEEKKTKSPKEDEKKDN